MPTSFGNPEVGWVILSSAEARIKAKIEEAGNPLKEWDVQINYGIKTGFNEAFIIDGKTKDELIRQSPKSAEIIHPIMRGRDVERYKSTFADKWLINTHNGLRNEDTSRIDVITKYPLVYEHLNKYETELKKRLDKGVHWTNLRNCAYLKDFEKEKIIWIELTDPPKFSFDTSKYLLNNTIFFMVGKSLKYILSILNSKVCEWYFDKIAATSGAGTRRWIKMYIDQIIVPVLEEAEQKSYVDLVDRIIQAKSDNLPTKIAQIELDHLIYNLFKLNQHEIDIVEKSSFIKYDS